MLLDMTLFFIEPKSNVSHNIGENMTITDLFVKLEAAVKDAQGKQALLNAAEVNRNKLLEEANLKVDAASKNYSNALSEVEALRTQLSTTLGDIFPSSRVRQAQ